MSEYNHSKHIKQLWKDGHYKKRNQEYRKGVWAKSMSNSLKQLWKDGKFTEERNKKISKSHKGMSKPWLRGHRDYSHVCKICHKIFITKTQHRAICDNPDCQNKKGSIRIYSEEVEKNRRRKISQTMKGRIPKNLITNINLKNSPPQLRSFEIIKRYFPDAKYNYKVKTKKSRRFLDIALVGLKIDIEYNGKIHLMKSVQYKDEIRSKQLKALGWITLVIDRNNFDNLDEMIQQIYCEHKDSNE